MKNSNDMKADLEGRVQSQLSGKNGYVKDPTHNPCLPVNKRLDETKNDNEIDIEKIADMIWESLKESNTTVGEVESVLYKLKEAVKRKMYNQKLL